MKKLWILGIVICFLFFSLGFFSAKEIKGGILIDIDRPHVLTYSHVTQVRCGSNSMNGVVHCGDTLYLRQLLKDEPLILGAKYIFNQDIENISLVHRLIHCPNTECEPAIFKGDGNIIADPPVYRKDIKYKVLMTEYAK
jgi:hypothetical protein